MTHNPQIIEMTLNCGFVITDKVQFIVKVRFSSQVKVKVKTNFSVILSVFNV